MELKLNRISLHLYSSPETWNVELTGTIHDAASGDVSPDFANFTVRMTADEISSMTISEIEAAAIRKVRTFQL
jgi:phosphodiesterase/alkaline phosphatase D-like protein